MLYFCCIFLIILNIIKGFFVKKIKHLDFEFEVDELIHLDEEFKYKKYAKFMAIAKSVSELSNFNKHKLGAIAVKQGVVVARGMNAEKSHPLQKLFNKNRIDCSDDETRIHAELQMLNRLKAKFNKNECKKIEVYIFHVNNLGEQKMARPCAGCMDAIKQAGIRTIHYSTPDGFATERLSDEKKPIYKGKMPI